MPTFYSREHQIAKVVGRAGVSLFLLVSTLIAGSGLEF
jgi:hypothetical protein